MAKPDDLYGTFGSVPRVGMEGGGRPYASPNAYGAQVGAAVEKTGQQVQRFGDQQMELATQAAKQATEAKVNDDYAKKYVPAAIALRNQYDQLEGPAKVQGYDGYIKSLQELSDQHLSGAKSDYEKKLWGGLTSDTLVREQQSANRELAASQQQYSGQAALERTLADQDIATMNYNNPAVVNQKMKSMVGVITLNAIDSGLHPDSDEVHDMKRAAIGKTAVSMADRAISLGDINEANKITQKFAPVIPGYQRDALDAKLSVANSRHNGIEGAKAIVEGRPIPPSVGAPPAHVQAVTANTAVAHGVNPNHALTLINIESNYGQNVGKRGDIGQTRKGGNLQQQAANAMIEWKKSTNVATRTLGRAAAAWETYVCYQQGEGGGPALLEADRSAKAIDVLRPLYKSARTAMEAICNNGGTATSSVGDFLDHWQKTWARKEKQSAIALPENGVATEMGTDGPISVPVQNQETQLSSTDEAQFQTWLDEQHNSGAIKDGDYNFYRKNGYGYDYDFRAAFQAGLTPGENGHWGDLGKKPNHPTFSTESKYADATAGTWVDGEYVPAKKDGPDLGADIMRPHEETGEVVQPAATPRAAYNEFATKFPVLLARANQIANLSDREYVRKGLKQMLEDKRMAATAYSSTLVNSAQQLAQKPDFTSIEQVPAEMAAALLTEHPDTMHYLEVRANQNLEKKAGGVSKDMTTYGPAMFDLMRDIHNGTIKSTDELIAHLPRGDEKGDLTIAGYDRLVKEFSKDPESASDGVMKTQAFKVIKMQLSGEDSELGIKDPKGEELYSRALPKLFKALDEGKAKGLTIGEMTDPASPHWIGKNVQSLQRSPVQMGIDMGDTSQADAAPKVTMSAVFDAMDKAPDRKDEILKQAHTMKPIDIYKEYKALPADKKEAFKRRVEELGLIRADLPKAPITQ